MKKELPLLLKLIRGAIGKEYVIKHYKDGAVKTKYPDMSGIIPTAHQTKCRNLFKEAVAYAKNVIADLDKKKCWQKKLRKPNSVYNAAIKEYMLRTKKEKQNQFIEANRMLMKALKSSGNENVQAFGIMKTPAGILTELPGKKAEAETAFNDDSVKTFLAPRVRQTLTSSPLVLNST